MGQGFKPTPYTLPYTIYINNFMYFLPIKEQDYTEQLDSDKSYFCYNSIGKLSLNLKAKRWPQGRVQRLS